MTVRMAILVDGFNLYHSLESAIDDGAPTRIKWLDISALVGKTCLHAFGPDTTITESNYFTSLNTKPHRKESLSRHNAYLRALKSQGFSIHYGQFKDKDVECRAHDGCAKLFRVAVEKRTDVAIACRILEILALNKADGLLIISGDTDLVPAIETARRLYPERKVGVAFPYKRHNYELQGLARPTFMFTIEHYRNNILPERIEFGGKSPVTIPQRWR